MASLYPAESNHLVDVSTLEKAGVHFYVARSEGRVVGCVALVGAGPGDPELITLKGARLLREADVVIYDNLVAPGLLDLCSPAAERIFVGKMAGNHTLPQDEISQLVVDKALARCL